MNLDDLLIINPTTQKCLESLCDTEKLSFYLSHTCREKFSLSHWPALWLYNWKFLPQSKWALSEVGSSGNLNALELGMWEGLQVTGQVLTNSSLELIYKCSTLLCFQGRMWKDSVFLKSFHNVGSPPSFLFGWPSLLAVQFVSFENQHYIFHLFLWHEDVSFYMSK